MTHPLLSELCLDFQFAGLFFLLLALPLGQKLQSVELDHESQDYEQHFKRPNPLPTVQAVFPSEFLAAFEEEFGLTIDELRGIRDAFADLAVEKRKCVFLMRKDEILSYCGKNKLTTASVAEKALERFVLWPRESWDKTPEGFRAKDWYPWRFGRRLSLIARPLVKLEGGTNPRYVISPGLFGDGITYTMRRYYEAEADFSECQTQAMKKWISGESNRRGHAFAGKVFNIMKALGYEALLEQKISTLLNEQLDRNWGDVDVLAWKPSETKVLAIECKDLKLAKTPNEMAEHLNRFTGQMTPTGKRDELLKHLERCDFLRERSESIAKKIGSIGKDIHIQIVVCFSKPVPMQYVTKRFPNVVFTTLDQLQELAEDL